MSQPQFPIFIGLDGGGTGCRLRITDTNGMTLAEGKGGAANVTTDQDLALANLTDLISKAGAEAKLSDDALRTAQIHLGLAGVMSDAIATSVAKTLPFPHITVTDDRPTSLAGALGGQDGFLVSVGTGTIIASRHGGQNAFIGGWGFAVSDQASAAWLGRNLLEQTLLCHDGLAPHSDLTHATLSHFDNDPNAIVAFSTPAKPNDFGALAPCVVDAAQRGDPIGTTLMQQGAAYLTAGLTALGFAPGDRLCLTGGVGEHYESLFPAEIRQGIMPAKGNAVDGAILLAHQAYQSRHMSTA